MLRYKTETRPGLVALCDIRLGNGAGPFLQPRSQHGARGHNGAGQFLQPRSSHRTRGQIEPSLVDFCNIQPAHRPSIFRELYSVHEVTYKQTDLGNNRTSAVTQQLLHVTK